MVEHGKIFQKYLRKKQTTTELCLSVVFPAVGLPRILADSNETLASLTNQTYVGFYIDPVHDVSWIGESSFRLDGG
jgi:hypothetical protein